MCTIDTCVQSKTVEWKGRTGRYGRSREASTMDETVVAAEQTTKNDGAKGGRRRRDEKEEAAAEQDGRERWLWSRRPVAVARRHRSWPYVCISCTRLRAKHNFLRKGGEWSVV